MASPSRASVSSRQKSGVSRRLALVLANGAYLHRGKLSLAVDVCTEFRTKLDAMGFEVVGADDQDLEGMRAATRRWLELVRNTIDVTANASTSAKTANQGEPPLVLLVALCGHGRAGQLFPVDASRETQMSSMYCFMEDLLIPLYNILGGNACLGRRTTKPAPSVWRSVGSVDGPFEPSWYLPGVQLVALVESCRRLSSEDQEVYNQSRLRVANGRRHLLPSLAAFRPDLDPLSGGDWDAARFASLSRLGGVGAPRVLLALSSEATTASRGAIFLRSITDAIDRPVRLGGILERASQATLRRTGHKQRPVLLSIGGAGGVRDFSCNELLPQDLVLAAPVGTSYAVPLSGSLESRLKCKRRMQRSASLPAVWGVSSATLPALQCDSNSY
mmetsp:Transcript_107537/g.213574  ORF Transcript_107537/g.213574 Transcript_107537/m.213574 type:complete len:388 (-) Transcript_107537:25-1188(-)